MDSMTFFAFLSGAIMMAYLITAMFFYRFWQQTKDRLFKIFAYAFILLTIERVILLYLNTIHEERTFIYLIRLAAFLLIIYGVLQKNRPQPHPEH